MRKKNSCCFIAVLLALVFIIGGCQMDADDTPEIVDDPGQGTLVKETAKKIFDYEDDTVTPGGIAIIHLRDADALKAYLAGKRQAASERDELTIKQIDGKPVTRIAKEAFKPTDKYPADITQVVKKINLPETIVVLEQNLFAGTEFFIEVDIPPQAIENIKGYIKEEIRKATIEQKTAELGTEPDAEALKKIEDEVDATLADADAAINDLVKAAVVDVVKDSAARVTVDPAKQPEIPVIIEEPIVGTEEANVPNPETEAPPPELPATEAPPVPSLPGLELPPAVTPSEPSTPSNPPPVVTPPYTPPYTPPPAVTPPTPPQQDKTPPVLSGGTVSNTVTSAGTTATISFTSNKAGKYFYVVLPSSAAAPDADAIKAQASGVTCGTDTATAGANSIFVTGLAVGTAYKAYIIVVDNVGNTSDVLEIASFTPTRTAAGQLAADLGSNDVTVSGDTVTLRANKDILSNPVTVPAGVTLATGDYTLFVAPSNTLTVAGTLNVAGTVNVSPNSILTVEGTVNVAQNGTLTMAGTLSITGVFTMAGTLNVETMGAVNVENHGTLTFAATRTGGGYLYGLINVKSGGVSKDLKSGGGADGLWSAGNTGGSVFDAGALGYIGGDDPDDLMIGTTDNAMIQLTSGTFGPGYVLNGNATLNRTFGIDGNQTFTIKNGKLTVEIRHEDSTAGADGAWVIGPNAKIVGEGTASIEVKSPVNSVQNGLIYITNGGTSNFYDNGGNQITTANPHIAIGVGTYKWEADADGNTNNGDQPGWKKL